MVVAGDRDICQTMMDEVYGLLMEGLSAHYENTLLQEKAQGDIT